jgi:hypothetical protein
VSQVFRIDNTQNSLPWVGEDNQCRCPLSDIGMACPGTEEPLDLGLLIIGAEVQVSRF